MKIGTTIYIILALVVILPSIGAASPGIIVTLDELSKPTQNGTMVNYQVIITNTDGDLDIDGNCYNNCWNKTISSLFMSSTQAGWIYDIEPLLDNNIPAGSGNSVTTVLHVTPIGATSGPPYNHTIDVIADATYFESGVPMFSLSEMGGYDSDYENFATIIENTGGATIPEFPTVALPIISVLGLVYVMYRRK